MQDALLSGNTDIIMIHGSLGRDTPKCYQLFASMRLGSIFLLSKDYDFTIPICGLKSRWILFHAPHMNRLINNHFNESQQIPFPDHISRSISHCSEISFKKRFSQCAKKHVSCGVLNVGFTLYSIPTNNHTWCLYNARSLHFASDRSDNYNVILHGNLDRSGIVHGALLSEVSRLGASSMKSGRGGSCVVCLLRGRMDPHVGHLPSF